MGGLRGWKGGEGEGEDEGMKRGDGKMGRGLGAGSTDEIIP